MHTIQIISARLIFTCCLFITTGLWQVYAQTCPANIGVEDGTFTNWKCYAGSIDSKGVITVTYTKDPLTDVHTILKNTLPQAMDQYGNFPVNCPNGSGYSIQLGNNSTGAEAERITYTYTIPANQSNFSLLYYQAIVLQSGGHLTGQEPAFQTAIKDVTPPAVLATLPNANPSGLVCGTNLYSPVRGTSGFKVSATKSDVYYKEWTPVIINLDNYAGHTIEISFTTNDCTQGSHFGYAYLDFNEVCASPYDGIITGNKVCAGAQNITLSAPPGFLGYTWFDDQDKVLGSKSTLKLNPIPAIGTKYKLVVTPYPGLGCVSTLYTEIKQSTENFNFMVQPNVTKCRTYGVDLTADAIKPGNTPGLKYEYYTDAEGRNLVQNPKMVTTDGTYYIRASNASGCTDIQSVSVHLSDGPVVKVNPPAPVCYPATVDLTKVFTTTETSVSFVYYTDPVTKSPINNYTVVNSSGTYYAEATSTLPGLNCSSVSTTNVVINPLPAAINAASFSGCSPLNLNTYAGTDASLTYRFFTDAQGLQPVSNPASVTAGGTYYYKALNQSGCESNTAQFDVTVFPAPVFTVTDPAPVVKPQVVNLADTYLPVPGLIFSYWQDAAASKPLANYQTINESGTYYIQAVNGNNCPAVQGVHVTVNEPPGLNLTVKNTFSPNGDGINDKFIFTVKGSVQMNYLKIYNRSGQQIFETKETDTQWDGTYNGKPMPSGTYYWVFSGYDTYYKQTVNKSGPVTIIR